MVNFMLEATTHADLLLQFYSANRKILPPLKFQPFFDITNGSRDMGNFMLETTAHACPPIQFHSANS